MLAPWIIEKKRDGHELSTEEIRFFIAGFTTGEVPDYQMSALAMAIYWRGMNTRETADLTVAMMESGVVLDLSGLPGMKVDKHSSGGVGDKISLPLAPLAAACGVIVPMISGRGLGITGGTLDKLDSIPGYRTNLSDLEFIAVLRQCGCSIIGQTAQIAPADRKLYALRDVTATVPSIPLIVSSIMSKKLASGLDALALDVKWGAGAFMKTRADARRLAEGLVSVGRQMGKKVRALITDMNQPLGANAGNALEVIESIEILNGRGPDDVRTLTVELAAHMLELGGVAPSLDAARQQATNALQTGKALQRFRQMVQLHGGKPEFVDDLMRWPAAAITETLRAPASGYVQMVDADKIGRACLLLGAGRSRADQTIDPSAGISGLVKTGARIADGDPLCVLHTSTPQLLAEARPWLDAAFRIGPEAAEPLPLIAEIL